MAEIGLRNTPLLVITTAIDLDYVMATSIFLGNAEELAVAAVRTAKRSHFISDLRRTG
jgi:hypothetical protein